MLQEHWTAVMGAYKDKLDLSISVAVGSSIQIAYVNGRRVRTYRSTLNVTTSSDSSSSHSRSFSDGSSVNLCCKSRLAFLCRGGVDLTFNVLLGCCLTPLRALRFSSLSSSSTRASTAVVSRCHAEDADLELEPLRQLWRTAGPTGCEWLLGCRPV
jgi:hypothetical protein